MTTELLSAPLDRLRDEASGIRQEHFGDVVTFSPKVFLPLTQLCRDRCGYCTFAEPPAHVASPYMSLNDVRRVAEQGVALGCTEALFTLGERPELRYPIAAEWLQTNGYDSTVDYLVAACAAALDAGLLPHANAGALYEDELAALRTVSASQGMMLESLNDDLSAHRGSPDKTAERRLATLEAAGRLRIPFTTGILVGFGESRADRIEALTAIAASHEHHGQVQEVIVQNFLPKAGTAMHNAPPCDEEEFAWSIAIARIILPPTISVQAPPNLTRDFGRLLDYGINDWGGVSPLTIDFVNPERPWPALDRLAEVTRSNGFELRPRLTVYDRYLDPDWISPSLRPIIEMCQQRVKPLTNA